MVKCIICRAAELAWLWLIISPMGENCLGNLASESLRSCCGCIPILHSHASSCIRRCGALGLYALVPKPTVGLQLSCLLDVGRYRWCFGSIRATDTKHCSLASAGEPSLLEGRRSGALGLVAGRRPPGRPVSPPSRLPSLSHEARHLSPDVLVVSGTRRWVW